ncbi:hypothetical protein [Herbaspirillum rhizosphaerae]|uniref:hypothetical protein n=1 Tax=Herbaspirillum rhizosphaerae TaxID=346179 RepID=UPI00067B96B7|nr:hypothetical protein [Herbaspirillum rhizosphaerae]
MKKLLILSSALLLSACADLSDRIGLLQSPAFEVASRPGATKRDVITALGQPRSSLATLNGRGTCSNYLANVNGQAKPVYIGFNQKEQVVAYGALTCEEAQKSGYLNATEPPKKK